MNLPYGGKAMKETVLEMVGISKDYPGVKALDNVTFEAARGEVHGLIGENGAGKSTLMKILNGVVGDYQGEIFIKGQKVKIHSPIHAQHAGVSIIFQELNLVNTLSIAENIFLGRLKTKNGLVDWKKVQNDTKEQLKKIGLEMDPGIAVGELSVAEKQMVEIAKALSYNADIIVMDEPSSTLTEKELDNLFKIIADLKSRGMTVIYISHRMEEIFNICDRITIMRDGKHITTSPVKDMTNELIIEKMVGRKMGGEYPAKENKDFAGTEVVLDVENICRDNVLKDISFQLHRGEILGISGLVGAGRTELLRAVFGADQKDSGKVCVNGKEVHINSPITAKKHGLALITEDRKQQGLVLKFPIKTNITATNLNKICKNGLISDKKEEEFAARFIQLLKVKTPSSRQKALNLSGGNQQKVVLAKWLYNDSDILFLDEPTRGIDVGAKYEIYCIMNDLVKNGKSIIMVSSDLPEVLGMSDRVLVMHDGKITGEFLRNEVTAEKVMVRSCGQ